MILTGTREDALWCALGANRAHGQRLTSADKKHAIELALEAWPEQSQSRDAAQDRSNRIVSVVVLDAQNLTAQEDLIDFRALDRSSLPGWIADLEKARATWGA